MVVAELWALVQAQSTLLDAKQLATPALAAQYAHAARKCAHVADEKPLPAIGAGTSGVPVLADADGAGGGGVTALVATPSRARAAEAFDAALCAAGMAARGGSVAGVEAEVEAETEIKEMDVPEGLGGGYALSGKDSAAGAMSAAGQGRAAIPSPAVRRSIGEAAARPRRSPR